MNCWDLLGIEPTSDRQRIEQAYKQQLKFASSDDAAGLEQAFREATVAATAASDDTVQALPHTAEAPPERSQELDAYSAQVAREVVIQIKALLNDNIRMKNADVWKAILCEPPADQLALRADIARRLESQLRPMAENGAFPASVAAFLGDWFEWPSLREAASSHGKEQQPDQQHYPEPEMMASQGKQDEQPRQAVNFWPAVIGWIIGLAILTTLFGGMGGG